MFQFQTTAINLMLQELVFHAIKDINCKTSNAFYHHPKVLLIWVVPLGIGTIKYVSNAQPDGSSTLTKFVLQFLMIATNTMLQLVPVLLVSKVTLYLMVNVWPQALLPHQTWAVQLGIGTTKYV